MDDDVEGRRERAPLQDGVHAHPYHWPTIGWMEDIKGFTPEDCAASTGRTTRRTTRRSSSSATSASGACSSRSATRTASIPASRSRRRTSTPEPPQIEERRLELRKPTASEKLLVAFKGPALGDADHATMSVLSEVLFGGRASRLYRALVVERELAIDVRGWVSTFRDPGLFECWATARGAHTAPEILPVLDEAFARIRAEVVGDEELARAKARLELGSLQQLETVGGKAEQIGFFETVLGEPAHAFRRVEAYRRVTVERSAAGRAALPRRHGAHRPPRRSRDTGGRDPARPRRRHERAAKLRTRAHAGLVPMRFDLDGGTLALLESSHDVPLVSLVVALRCGSAVDPSGKSGLSRIAMRMLRRGCERLQRPSRSTSASTR